MDYLKEFNEMMANQTELALATMSSNNTPNVRVVNFYYDNTKGIVYFATFSDNKKVEEIAKNNKVAFTTIPANENEGHIRSNETIVRKSNLTIYDIKDEFVSKMPSYEMIIKKAGDHLDVYEIHFNKARVILDFEREGEITL